MKVIRTFALALSTAALLASAACGGDDNSLEGSDNTTGGEPTGSTEKGSLTISGQDFTEMQIMAAMYQQVLAADGYDVTLKLVQTRDIYIKGLSDGSIDVVPEYLAGITDFLNTEANGDGAESVSTNDPDETLAALKPLAEAKGISMLEPSSATDQNAFFVTKEFADENSLTTLSDLAALNIPIKLAAPPDCKGRSDCEGGLTNVYGLNITEIIPTGFGGAATLDAVKKNEAQLGETGTTDGSLEAQGLVLLEDDKGIQPAQNLIPAVNADFLTEHPDIADVLNNLSSTLTTEDLGQLNLKVDAERQKPEDVASEYLTSKGLI
jgi:osmoprotectant transport system substrate-binding protein